MTDEQLAQLFADGTTSERDAELAQRVDARIGQARLGRHLPVLAVRALLILTIAAAVFMTIRTIEPMLKPILEPITESSPHFMGVPLPLMLAAAVLALAVRALRFVRLRLS